MIEVERGHDAQPINETDCGNRPVKGLLLIVGLVVAGLLGFVRHLGYFGGPVFIDMPASARTAPARSGIAAVLLSGDMGIHVGMGPEIAERLTADGIPVVAVNSLSYFRTERTPAEVTALVADAARRALALGHAGRLVLIGQSFGADMLHVGLTGLPADLRTRIAGIVLVVPTDTVNYRASPGELFGWATPDAPALPTALKLGWSPVLCIYGAEENASLCPMLNGRPNIRTVMLPGGHPLHRDADALYAAMKPAIVAAAAIGSGARS